MFANVLIILYYLHEFPETEQIFKKLLFISVNEQIMCLYQSIFGSSFSTLFQLPLLICSQKSSL